jgi:SAM-dependent methyltransferase
MTSAAPLHIASSNTEQARAWDGDEGEYWAAHAAQFDRGVATYHDRFLAAAAIRPTDAVLDVGCGTGQTSRDAARRASEGHVLGIDLSARMLDVARAAAAAEGLTNVAFEQADAQVHPFGDAVYDVVISRTGTMFFGDPLAAFANIARALRPGGHLVMLVWQAPQHNEWISSIVAATAAGRDLPAPPRDAPGPFSLADPDRVRALLGAAGLTDVTLTGLTGAMHFGATADEAFAFVAGLTAWMLEGLDGVGRARALADLHAVMARHETPDGVRMGSATWLVTAARP